MFSLIVASALPSHFVLSLVVVLGGNCQGLCFFLRSIMQLACGWHRVMHVLTMAWSWHSSATNCNSTATSTADASSAATGL